MTDRLSTPEAARLVGVHANTIRHWRDTGRLIGVPVYVQGRLIGYEYERTHVEAAAARLLERRRAAANAATFE